MERFALTFPNQRLMDDEAFFDFCEANRDLRIERESNGQIMIMAPTGGTTGARNSLLTFYLVRWNLTDQDGMVFDSSTGFRLTNGAVRSPDAAWMRKEKWNRISTDIREKFISIPPDFIIELKSPSDMLNSLKQKMEEWREFGCRLGWLLAPDEKKAFIYGQDGSVKTITSLDTPLTGEDILPGFELNLSVIK